MDPRQRDFRVAVSISDAPSVDAWRDKLRRVSDLGFDALHVPDHFGDLFSTGPALASAAILEPELALASMVYDNDFRHPALLAQEVATLATLSAGRFEFGIGAGWLKKEYDETGIPWDAGSIRLERLIEALEIIQELLRGERVTFTGNHYRITDFEISAPPEPPRLMIGGGGPRMLELAAARADIVSVLGRALPEGGLDPEDWSSESFLDKVRRVEAAAGDRMDEIELHLLIQKVDVTSDRRAGLERLAAEWDADPGEVARNVAVLIGSADEIAAQVHERRNEFGFSYLTVFERDMEAFAPIAALIRGPSNPVA